MKYQSIVLGIAIASSFSISAQNHYNLVGVSANQTHFNSKSTERESDSDNMLGFGVNYLYGHRVLRNVPLYAETGLGMKFMFYTNHLYNTVSQYEGSDGIYGANNENIRQRIQMMTLTIPVNLAYDFNISKNFSISPFVGIDLKTHIYGWMTDIRDDKDGHFEECVSVFDNNPDSMDGMAWRRFQAGWNAGLRIVYRHIFASASYGTDFTKLCKHPENRMSTQNISVTFGYKF